MSTQSDPVLTLILEQFRGLREDLSEHRRESKADIAALRKEVSAKIAAAHEAAKPGVMFATKAQGAWFLSTALMSGGAFILTLWKQVFAS